MENGVLRLLFIGDVVGPTGCAAIERFVPALRTELALDGVIANGENSADSGLGVSPETARRLLSNVDFLTLGDHTFDQGGIGPFLDSEPRIIRPANYEDQVAGRGWGTFAAAGVPVGVANLLGRLFMRPKVRSPYAAADAAIGALRGAGARVILIDMQAEATSEKVGMGWHLDGRAAAVLGTHTHVPTADLRILPGGTAYVSDIGMTGGRDGIIGFSRETFLPYLVTGQRPERMRVADAPARLDAILLQINAATGQAIAAERILREG